MKKKELVKKANELIERVSFNEVTEVSYCLECQLQKVNVTPCKNRIRFYCRENETIKNIEKIINLCENILNNKG